jgi:hypothetical protein
MSKNKKKGKKLLLKRETVKELAAKEMAGAAGGTLAGYNWNATGLSCPTAGTWTFSIQGSIVSGGCETMTCSF